MVPDLSHLTFTESREMSLCGFPDIEALSGNGNFRVNLWIFAEKFGNYETLKAMTSTAGELMALTKRRNPYPNKLGVIKESAYADILLIDGNPLEDISVLGANQQVFEAKNH
jgi:imidazolonepropionase-like amidohydrolase